MFKNILAVIGAACIIVKAAQLWDQHVNRKYAAQYAEKPKSA